MRWIVEAVLSDGKASFIGPFVYQEDAERWLSHNDPASGFGCIRKLLSPPEDSMPPMAHYPVSIDVQVMDTDDDMVILPGTFRAEAQQRCGCTDSLEHTYGAEGHRP